MIRKRAAYFVVFMFLFVLGQVLGSYAPESRAIQQTYAGFLCFAAVAVATHRARVDGGFLSCFTIVQIVPIWFLYLEALLSTGDAWTLPVRDVIRTLSYAAFFQCAFLLFYRPQRYGRLYQLHDKYLLRSVGPNFLAVSSIGVVAVTFVAVLLRYDFDWEYIKQLYLAGRAGGEGIIRRSGVGGVEVFFQPLQFMSYAVPTMAALCWVRLHGQRLAAVPLRVAAAAAAVFIIFVAFLNGSRNLLAVYLAGPALVWCVFGSRLPRLIFLAISCALFLGVIGIWEYQVQHRTYLLEQGTLSEMVRSTKFNPAETHRDNNLYIFTLNVMYVPERYPYGGFADIWYIIVNPIPRAIWKNKPLGIQEDETTFSVATGPVAEGPIRMGTASLSSSIVCDGYKAAHVLGIIFYAAVMAWLGSFWDELAKRRFVLTALYFIMHSMWLFWFMWGFRAAFAFVTAMYGVWGGYAICAVLGTFGAPLVFRRTNVHRNVSVEDKNAAVGTHRSAGL